MADFLACLPNVFAVRDSYQILLCLREPGICWLRVGDRAVYETENGVLRTESKVRRICLPQTLLDRAGGYTVCYRRAPERKAYCTELGPEERATFCFFPVEKTEGIRGVYIADVHSRYDAAVRAVKAAGPSDFLIVNGDISEVETEEDLLAVNDFIGRVGGAEKPVICGRGNHDTRGRLSERLPEHLPTEEGRTYFPFRFGPVSGVVLDCGEDKEDGNKEYGGVNLFAPFRREEAERLRRMRLPQTPYRLAVCHIPFFSRQSMRGVFDIARPVYRSFGRSLARLAPDLLLCGHSHRYERYAPGEEGSHFPHPYPALVGSRLDGNGWGCTTVALYPDRIEIFHTDEHGKTESEPPLMRECRPAAAGKGEL